MLSILETNLKEREQVEHVNSLVKSL